METLIIISFSILIFVGLITKIIGLFSKKAEKRIDKILSIFCIVIGLIFGLFLI
jgi:hypothetical protein